MFAQIALLQESRAAHSAKESSFYPAMRMMALHQRAAMYEIYHFCRMVDAIADDERGDSENRLAALQLWRKNIALMYVKRHPSALNGLAAAVSAFGLHWEDFFAVIDGMEMDVRGPIAAPSRAALELYCDRVAGAVGRLSVCVFGFKGQAGQDLAHHLGMALQLTNILRDLDEDAAMGRLYLPRELLDEAAITDCSVEETLAHPAIGNVCMQLAAQAASHFSQADNIMNRCEPRLARTPRVMSQAYQAVYAALLERGFTHPRPKIQLNKLKLGLILAKSMFF